MAITTLNTLARHNVWATARLIQVLETVSDEDFFKDQGLFFKSIFGTLNHILVGEHYLWFARFSQGRSEQLPLDSIIEPDRQALLEALQQKSHHWIEFLQQLEPSLLTQQLHYTNIAGQALSLPYAATLQHVFNHSTHHRGQISAALTQMGYPTPVMDLVYMLIEEKQQAQSE